MPNITVDIGDLCTHCGEDTALGSGKFVNRIPSSIGGSLELANDELDVGVEGYMCEECQCVECDKCNEMVTDYSISEAGELLCSTCDSKEGDK